MPYSTQTQQKLCFDLQPIIAVGDTESNAIDLSGTSLVGFITDANLTGTAFTFKVSSSLAGTYLPLKNNSGAISRTVATSSYYNETSPDNFLAVNYVKIVSGTIQATNRTVITLVTRTIA